MNEYSTIYGYMHTKSILMYILTIIYRVEVYIYIYIYIQQISYIIKEEHSEPKQISLKLLDI